MGKKLYVGGLSFDVTEDSLHSMFAELGQVVSAKLIIDRDSGQSKGFGFVEMGTEEEAQNVIQKMNGKSMGTRQLTVNEARPMASNGPSKGGFGGGYGISPAARARFAVAYGFGGPRFGAGGNGGVRHAVAAPRPAPVMAPAGKPMAMPIPMTGGAVKRD